MDKKVLENITPYNDIYFKDCFYNSFFPVVSYYNKSPYPVLVNDVIVYKANQYDDTINLGIEYVECKLLEQLIEDVGIETDTKKHTDYIISDIVRSITINRPVIIWIDCFYESIRKEMYGKKHWGHTLLIYGFDNDGKTFNIVEHKYWENLSYEKRIISYEDIINSYEGYYKNFYKGTFPTYFDFYLSKSSQQNGLSEPSNNARNLEVYANNIISKKDLILSGLNDLDVFKARYEEVTKVESELARYSENIQGSINRIINAKQVDKYRLMNLYGQGNSTLDVLDNIISSWSKIRTTIAKYTFTSIYKPDAIQVSINVLNDVCCLEKQFHEKLFSLLKI